MSGTVTIGGSNTGLSNGSKVFNASIIAGACGVTTEVVLASGPNTITVPTNAAGCVITLPSTNTQAVTLKGVTGDTGIVIDKTSSHLLTFESTPPASFCLTSAGAQTGLYTVISFF